MTRSAGNFSEPGSIEPPGPIGRLVRFAAGFFCVAFAVQVAGSAVARIEAGRAGSFPTGAWISLAAAIYLLPEIVNVGFGRAWRAAYLRLTAAFVVLAGAGASELVWSKIAGPPLIAVGLLLVFYAFGHLGVSFLLAAFLPTPGCEMRSLPQLWGRLTGRPTREHYCAGLLTPLDRWEARHHASHA